VLTEAVEDTRAAAGHVAGFADQSKCARARGNEFFQQTLSHYGFTSSSDSKCAFMAKLCPRSMSPRRPPPLIVDKLLDLIHHLLLRGAKLAPRGPASDYFRPIRAIGPCVTLMRCLCSAGAAEKLDGRFRGSAIVNNLFLRRTFRRSGRSAGGCVRG